MKYIIKRIKYKIYAGEPVKGEELLEVHDEIKEAKQFNTKREAKKFINKNNITKGWEIIEHVYN